MILYTLCVYIMLYAPKTRHLDISLDRNIITVTYETLPPIHPCIYATMYLSIDLLSVAALITSRTASGKVPSSNVARLLHPFVRKLFRFTGHAFSNFVLRRRPQTGCLGGLGRLLGAS
jgi:hypothetical protein